MSIQVSAQRATKQKKTRIWNNIDEWKREKWQYMCVVNRIAIDIHT